MDKRRLKKLEERARALADTLLLADGTELHLSPGDRLDALLAAIDDEPHPLHALFARLGPDVAATDHELAALIAALVLEEA